MVSKDGWVYLWTEEGGIDIKYKIGEIRGLTGRVDNGDINSGKLVGWQTNVFDIKGKLTDVNCTPAAIPDGMLDADSRISFRKRVGKYDTKYSPEATNVKCKTYQIIPFDECLYC
jgi:hypothetical protein